MVKKKKECHSGDITLDTQPLNPPPRRVLEWLYTTGGSWGGTPPWTPHPPDQSDHSGKNEIYNGENPVRPFWLQKFWVPDPPLRPFFAHQLASFLLPTPL